MVTARQHREISEQFLAHAIEEFQRGDLLQASEKAWGAFSHCVSAIAKKRGWGIGSHKQTLQNARRIINFDPANAEQRQLLVPSLNQLHANFYNGFLERDDVEQGIQIAKEMIAALNELDARYREADDTAG